LNPGSTAAASNLSGTNPTQVGLGVITKAINTNFQQGTLQTTGGNYDLAIQGQGFFVANNGVTNLYTRAGAFGLDEKNFLVDPGTGYRAQRVGTLGEGDALNPSFQTPGIADIKIPLGTSIAGKPTADITLQGNLSANAVGPLAETLTSAQPFKSGGAAAGLATSLNGLDGITTAYAAGDVIQIQGTDVGATPVSASYTVTATSKLSDLIGAINGAFTKSTATLDPSGNLILKANSTGPAPLTLALSDKTGDTGSFPWTNHGFGVTVNGKNGDTVNSAIQVFDSQGTAHTLTLVFTKQTTNVWNMTASIPAGDGTMIASAINGITFNDDGSFRQITGGGQPAVSFQITGLTAPQMVNLGFGTPGKFDGLTQYGGASTLAATGQDGFAAGSLVSVSVGKDGVVEGVFSNGRTLSIAQVAIATFNNPGGLTREGSNYFSQSTQSGIPLLGTANSGDRGSIQQGALESSNVDVALEFTRLITAQRGFQVNTRTITVSDQILQDLANIQ
jgi:flagellar hook protein FlgE